MRDGDSDRDAPLGIPAGVPDLDRLDWDEIKKELHNQLFIRGLFTHQDVVRQQTALSGAVLAVLKRRLIGLYRDAGGK